MEYVEEKRKKQKLLKERKNQKNVMKKSEKAITLIALIITIIVLLILAGVSIAMLTGENGILNKAIEAKEKTKKADVVERVQMDLLEYQMAGNGDITKEEFRSVLDKYFEEVPEIEALPDDLKKSELKLKSRKEYGGQEIEIADIYDGALEVADDEQKIEPGEWNGEVNTPALKEGMTAKIIDESTGEPRDVGQDEEWYDYKENDGIKNDSKWANAQTEDGSMWVWIPRFAYKITSKPTSSDEAGTIDVKFISTDTKGTKAEGENVYKTEDGYIIHPAFTDDVEQRWLGYQYTRILGSKV